MIRDDNGTIQGVRYDELASFLLNELQQQRKELLALHRELARLEQSHR